ncbi:hypothetical protein HAX54_048317 [Datura stramonium]|uniref:Uncharacterized protein n=1 Tax=Datura stramonium TaxID=4076 RepID=A0ABS8WLB5_DATST|nr:hypothetical protein [Datura stramonium]
MLSFPGGLEAKDEAITRQAARVNVEKGIKKLLRILAQFSKLPKVSREDAKEFSFTSGLDNMESSKLGIDNNEVHYSGHPIVTGAALEEWHHYSVAC